MLRASASTAFRELTEDFDMRLDYWRFEYEDVITVENAQGKLQNDLNGDDIQRVAGDNSQLSGINVDYISSYETTRAVPDGSSQSELVTRSGL